MSLVLHHLKKYVTSKLQAQLSRYIKVELDGEWELGR
jgi:hypothetical protein